MMLQILHGFFLPLNIYFIPANFCCHYSFNIFNNYVFLKRFNCFKAGSINSSNCIIIFGNMNDKLAQLVDRNKINQTKYAVINLSCQNKIELFNCATGNIDIKKIVHEARLCLRT